MADAGHEARLPARLAGRGRRPGGAGRALRERARRRAWKTSSSTPAPRSLAGDLAAFTQLRRLALKKGARSLGYPIFAFAGGASWQSELVRATQAIAKYAGIVVSTTSNPALLYALLTLRQNIFTDPQKPIQVEPKLYEIGSAGPDSPLLITTNFSLTYFSVSGEVEGAGMPAWLLVADSRRPVGAHRLGGRQVRRREDRQDGQGLGHRRRASTTRSSCIPGHVAGLSGEAEEELPGWQIMVGPRDAVDIPNYLKNVWSA